MPIYEYACHHCRMVYQFFSKTMAAERAPVCPKCGRKGLTRLLSSFAAIKGSKSASDVSSEDGEDSDVMADDPFSKMPPAKQAAVEREMMKLMGDAENMDENDPRQIGHFMEKMAQIAGLEDKQMQEAIRRLKAGEDPEKIEEDMGDLLGGGKGEEGGPGGMGGYGQDPGLYDM